MNFKYILLTLLTLNLITGTTFAKKLQFSERIYLTESQALQKAFPKAEKISSYNLTLSPKQLNVLSTLIQAKFDQKNITIYKNKDTKKDSGFAVILDEIGKYYPITMMIKISPNHDVENVQVMVYRERIGSGVRKKRFLRQFFGKTSKDPLIVNRDIDGISGATMSSWSVSNAVKKALALDKELKL